MHADLRTDYDALPHRDRHELREKPGCLRKDSKAPLWVRLHITDKANSRRDLSVKRRRSQQDVVDPRGLVMTGRRPGKHRRQGDAYLNFATDKDILAQHAQGRYKGMQLFLNTPSTLLVGAIDVATSGKAADVCNRFLRRELSPEDEKLYSKDAQAAKIRELDARSQFKVYSPIEPGKCDTAVVGTRWAFTWPMVDGVTTVKARLVARGFQDPGLKGGLVETSGTVSPRPSHLQVIPLAALRGW